MFSAMAGITLEQAQTKLALWMAADDAVTAGQEYTYGNFHLKRSDSKLIKDNIIFWNRVVLRLSRGGMRVRTVEVDE